MSGARVTPRIICFDLEEVLMQIKLEGQRRTKWLSKSAELDLNKEHTIQNPPLAIHEGEELCGESATPLAHAKWKNFFRQLYAVQCEAVQNNKPVPFAVKIITTSNYGGDQIKKILDILYFDGVPTISANKFPIQYFNRVDIKKGDNIVSDPTKARLMKNNFEEWKKMHHMPTLTKEEVVLIDDVQDNINQANQEGFQGLLFTSNPYQQGECGYPKDASYAQTNKIFALLADYIKQFKKDVEKQFKEPTGKAFSYHLEAVLRYGVYSNSTRPTETAAVEPAKNYPSMNSLD